MTRSTCTPPSWYAEHGVDLREGVTVTAIDRAVVRRRHFGLRPAGTVALRQAAAHHRRLAAPAELPRLRPRRGALPAHAWRTPERLRAAFQAGTAGRGGRAGWIGLETTAAARAAGCSVTVVEPKPGALHDALGPELGARFADLHRAHGVEFRFGECATEFRPGMVITSAGAELPADVVVVGIGAVPNDGLAAVAGLEVDNGVVTD